MYALIHGCIHGCIDAFAAVLLLLRLRCSVVVVLVLLFSWGGTGRQGRRDH